MEGASQERGEENVREDHIAVVVAGLDEDLGGNVLTSRTAGRVRLEGGGEQGAWGCYGGQRKEVKTVCRTARQASPSGSRFCTKQRHRRRSLRGRGRGPVPPSALLLFGSVDQHHPLLIIIFCAISPLHSLRVPASLLALILGLGPRAMQREAAEQILSTARELRVKNGAAMVTILLDSRPQAPTLAAPSLSHTAPEMAQDSCLFDGRRAGKHTKAGSL